MIVTATAAVVAGLGGATLTAVINRKNTKDTLASARLANEEQWEQTQHREHALWLRDQKLEAYTEFLAVASALRHDLATKALEEKPNISTVDLTAKRLRVQVVGAPHVQQLATEVARQVMYLMSVQREARADAEGHKVGHAAQQTEDNRRKLDLLTESVRDASIGSNNSHRAIRACHS